MTPYWRKVMKALLSGVPGIGPGKVRAMAAMRCFDLRPCNALLTSTAQEIRQGMLLEGADRDVISTDLGPRTVVPADSCWIEWSNGWVCLSRDRSVINDFVGIEFETYDEDREYMLMAFTPKGDVNLGRLYAADDGIAIKFRQDDFPRPDQEAMAGMIMGAVAIINSPAALRNDVSPHKGLSRLVSRRLGQKTPRAISHVTVHIGQAKRGRSGAGGLVTTSNPKAYHFVRSHARELSPGSFTKVRAHWRGDPAFGIRVPHYSVEQGGLASRL